MRVRITAASLGRSGSFGKIGVTARQPFLGKLEWIEKDLKKLKLENEGSNEEKEEEK
jgi:DNA-directed RNA polymerase subunit E'